MTFVAAWSRLRSYTAPSVPSLLNIHCGPLPFFHLNVGKLSVIIFPLLNLSVSALSYTMLCHFCQNLVFVPIEEVSVQDNNWLTDRSFVYDRDIWLVSVHQPSRKALALSAGQGCRVCAMFWFQLFYDAEAAHAHHDSEPAAAPILLSMALLSWGNDSEPEHPIVQEMKLRCGEQLASLIIHKPVPGMADGHV